MLAYAQDAEELARNFVDRLNQAILFPLITLLLAVALVVFLWGCFQFIAGAASPDVRAQGQRNILWGIIGMVVMVSAYAILSVAANTFGLEIPS
jgi:uncharacterized membrane protein YbhN (UPF0104 family)